MPRCKARLVQEYVYLLPQPGYCALAFLLSLFKIFKKMCYECFPCILCVFVCVPRARRVQKRSLDILKLVLQTSVSHLWVLGTEPWESTRAANALNC